MKPTVFLDRDGVICKERYLLSRSEDLTLIPGSAEAIRSLNKNNFLLMLVTNQPIIARGICSYQDVKEINSHLLDMLKKEKAHIDAIYFCPHHPTEGDNPTYTRECDCRKPKPGMILTAAKDHGIETLADCFMVGDKIGDIKAGRDAGCKTILVETGYGGDEEWTDAVPDYRASDLLTAVNSVILRK